MKRAWSKRSLDSLRGIHPDLRRVMDRALAESPIDFVVIEGLRTTERQRQLVAQGASKTMNSRHITGHAVDLMPIGPDGKGAFDWPLYHRLAPAVKAAAKAEGVALVWGGDWKSFRDGPHFELDRKVYPAGAPAQKPVAPANVTKPAETLTRPAPHVNKPAKIEHGALTPNPVDDSKAPKPSGNGTIALVIGGALASLAAWLAGVADWLGNLGQ